MKMKSAMKAKKMSSMKMKKSMAKKAMKSMKKRAMKKTAKTYKSKQGAKNAVFSGKIMKTKAGRVVSKKLSAKGKASKWMKAVVAARKALGIKGFQIIGGKSAKGQQLLKKARSLYK